MGKKNKKIKVSKDQLLWQVERLRPIIDKTVRSLNYDLDLIEFVNESGFFYLRITISHQDKIINLEDCEKVSKAIDEYLDSDDKIPFQYSLEVQSPRRDIPSKCLHEFKLKGMDLVVNI